MKDDVGTMVVTDNRVAKAAVAPCAEDRAPPAAHMATVTAPGETMRNMAVNSLSTAARAGSMDKAVRSMADNMDRLLMASTADWKGMGRDTASPAADTVRIIASLMVVMDPAASANMADGRVVPAHPEVMDLRVAMADIKARKVMADKVAIPASPDRATAIRATVNKVMVRAAMDRADTPAAVLADKDLRAMAWVVTRAMVADPAARAATEARAGNILLQAGKAGMALRDTVRKGWAIAGRSTAEARAVTVDMGHRVHLVEGTATMVSPVTRAKATAHPLTDARGRRIGIREDIKLRGMAVNQASMAARARV